MPRDTFPLKVLGGAVTVLVLLVGAGVFAFSGRGSDVPADAAGMAGLPMAETPATASAAAFVPVAPDPALEALPTPVPAADHHRPAPESRAAQRSVPVPVQATLVSAAPEPGEAPTPDDAPPSRGDTASTEPGPAPAPPARADSTAKPKPAEPDTTPSAPPPPPSI